MIDQAIIDEMSDLQAALCKHLDFAAESLKKQAKSPEEIKIIEQAVEFEKRVDPYWWPRPPRLRACCEALNDILVASLEKEILKAMEKHAGPPIIEDK